MKCKECEKRGKFWHGSDPKCAFANGPEWSYDNWNCATTGLLRRLVDDDPPPDGVHYIWADDQNMMTVNLAPVSGCDRALSLWMTWYKNRGRTEQVWLMFDDKPPRRPTEAEILAVASAYSSNV